MDNITITFIITGITMVLMVVEIIPLAATMMFSALALVFTGILPMAKAYSYFGSSTIVFVVCMALIANGLFEAGIVQDIGNKIFRGKIVENERAMIFASSLLAGLATAIFLNSALVVIMIPLLAAAVMKSNGKVQMKHLLMGVAANATVGAAITLVGAAPNLMAQSILVQTEGVRGMRFFEMAPLALPLTVITAVYFATVGYAIQKRFYTFADVIDPSMLQTEKISFPRWKKWNIGCTLLLLITLFILEVGNTTILSFIAVGYLFATKSLNVKSSMRDVDWNMIIILACAQTLAAGLNESGAGALIAQRVMDVFGGAAASPFAVMVALSLISVCLTQIMSNTACCAMLTPIAISMALALNVNVMYFVIPMVCMAGTAIMTPIGSPCMTIALAGGYRAKDYMIVGAPLVVILTLISIGLTPILFKPYL